MNKLKRDKTHVSMPQLYHYQSFATAAFAGGGLRAGCKEDQGRRRGIQDAPAFRARPGIFQHQALGWRGGVLCPRQVRHLPGQNDSKRSQAGDQRQHLVGEERNRCQGCPQGEQQVA
jgi:hypothetical protein